MPKRILVADDSVTIQKAFAMVLGGQDFTVVPVRSQDEALSAARRDRPDLVIADVNLGSGSGYDLCSALKADGGLRAVPVYILASAHVPYDEGKGRKSGADGHLLKPFESVALVDRLGEILGSSAAASPAATAGATSRPTHRFGAPPTGIGSSAGPPAPTAVTAGASDDDDLYGEFTIERTGPGAPPPRPPAAAPAANLRPSMVPPPQSGPAARPPFPPPSRTPQPSLASSAGSALGGGPIPSQPKVTTNRTIMGFPAVIPPPGSSQTGGQARPAPTPGMPPQRAPQPAPTAAPAPFAAPAFNPATAAVTSAAVSAVDGKIAELSARGPEYAAIANLSREVIERVVWEVVPELAELIIREQAAKLANRS